MGDIARIEAARGGRFEFRHKDEVVALVSPDELDYQEVLAALNDPRWLLEMRMPEWKRTRARDAWAAHHDLPGFQHAQRLCYLVDRYAAPLTFALRTHAGVDLLELWHARRWQTLLDIIDHLPPTSAYAVAISQDEEHAKMLAEALAKREKEEGDKDSGPSLAGWSPEVEAITALRNDVRALQYYVRAGNGDTKAKPPAPLPVPVTPLQRAMREADFDRRKAKHQSLVARMLPHKARD